MLSIEGWGAKNYVLFDSVDWEVKPGVTFILGRNKQRRSPSASNASGKSLLTGILPSVLFDAHSVVSKGGKAVQRKFYEKETEAYINLISGKNQYQFKKEGSHVYLFKNGKNLDSRVARASLQKLFPLSEEEFFSTVYVDGRRYSNFLLGTAADRAAFISGLFRLDHIEETRQSLGKQLNALKEQQARLEELAARKSELIEKLKTFKKNLPDEVELLGKKSKVLQEKMQLLQIELQKHSAYSVYRAAKKELACIDVPEITEGHATKLLSNWAVYEKEMQDWETAAVAWKKRTSTLRKLGIKQEQLDFYAKALGLRSQAELNKCKKPEPIEKPENGKQLVAKRPKILQKVQRVQNRIDSLTASIQKISKLKQGSCPTCQQDIPHTHLSSLATTLQTEKQELEKELQKYEKALELADQHVAYHEYTIAKQRWLAYVVLLNKIKDYPFDKVKTAAKLQEIKNPGEKPKAPSISKDVVKAAIEAHGKIRSVKATLATISVDRPTLDETSVRTKLQQYSSMLSKIQARLPVLESNLLLRKQALSELQRTNERMAELTADLADLPIVEMLHRAYSGKGANLRTLVLGAIAKRLESNLNAYSKYVFEEGFKFKLDVSPGKFDVIVSRLKGKASDIRYFSGAESRLFSVVFLLSILPMIPANRRCNLLVLDEPTANMDAPALEVFRDVLLPQLAKVVPSVIVVTPNHEAVPQRANVFTVVKSNGKSILKKGIQ